ncbi:MAG TPA: hypothetical protein VMF29_03760 [Candidatus Edwardsbacteria bacterium]|nr:hypothetical protein [Candidatus Edwardsbacteria bacterium]
MPHDDPDRRAANSRMPWKPAFLLLGAGALLLLPPILVIRAIGIGLIVLAAELFFIHLYESLLPRDHDDPRMARNGDPGNDNVSPAAITRPPRQSQANQQGT